MSSTILFREVERARAAMISLPTRSAKIRYRQAVDAWIVARVAEARAALLAGGGCS